MLFLNDFNAKVEAGLIDRKYYLTSGYGNTYGCGYGNNTEWIWILVIIFIIFFLFWGNNNNNNGYNNCHGRNN